MLHRPVLYRWMSAFCICAAWMMSACPALDAKDRNLEGKVVLANFDKYELSFRVGRIQKSISPKKASILSPKMFPLTLEIWSGNAQLKWQQVTINESGLQVCRFTSGRWTVTQRQPRAKTVAVPGQTTSRQQTVVAPRTAVATRTVVTPRTTSRMVGSPSRIVQRGGGTRVVVNPPRFGRTWRGSYWSPITRGIWAIGSIYRFIRDEEDRDLFRRLIVDREIDDAVRREIEDRIWDKIKDDAINLPSDDLDQLRRAWDEIRDIPDEDWKQAVNLPTEEWDRIRDELKDEFSDADWKGIEEEIGDIGDTMDISDADIAAMDEVGLEDLEQEVDLGDLDGANLGEIGELDLGDAVGEVDLGDVSMDADNLDLGDLSEIGGVDWGLSSDLADADVGVSDVGGQLADSIADQAGGFDTGNVDGGGWDSYDYGNFDWGGGNDWGGGDLGGEADWGSDLGGGGDWGGDIGGDWGGGDWGGGGFDDFGGGFDDFGGDFDF